MDGFVVDNIKCIKSGTRINGFWADFTCSVNGITDKVSLTTEKYQDDPMPPYFESGEVQEYHSLHFDNADNQASYKTLKRFNKTDALDNQFLVFARYKNELDAIDSVKSITELLDTTSILSADIYSMSDGDSAFYTIGQKIFDDHEFDKKNNLILKCCSKFENDVIKSAPGLGEANNSDSEKVLSDSIYNAALILRDKRNNRSFEGFLSLARNKMYDGTFAFVSIKSDDFEKALSSALVRYEIHSVKGFLSLDDVSLDKSFKEISDEVQLNFDITDKDLYELLTSDFALDLSDDTTVPGYLKENHDEKSQSLTHNDISAKDNKYSLTDTIHEVERMLPDRNIILHQIKAEKDFVLSSGYHVKKGELGGFIESADNLSQYGMCWIMKDAEVMDDSRVLQNAIVCGESNISGQSRIDGNAIVSGTSFICNNVHIGDNVFCDDSFISDKSKIVGKSKILSSSIFGDSTIADCKMVDSSLDTVMFSSVDINNAKLSNAEFLYMNHGDLSQNQKITGQSKADSLMNSFAKNKVASKLTAIKNLGTRTKKNMSDKDVQKSMSL